MTEDRFEFVCFFFFSHLHTCYVSLSSAYITSYVYPSAIASHESLYVHMQPFIFCLIVVLLTLVWFMKDDISGSSCILVLCAYSHSGW